MRICSRCRIEKKITKFKIDKRREDGRTITCRQCYETNQIGKWSHCKKNLESAVKSNTGRKYSLAHRLAISLGQKRAVEEGKYHWKKNDTQHKDQLRCRIEYKIWREALLRRCENKCEECGNNKRLHAHHIKCFYQYPEIRFSLENGKILCQSCHSRLHKIRDKTGRRKS